MSMNGDLRPLRRMGQESWGEKFHRAWRRGREAGRVRGYLDASRQLARLPLPVRSDASIVRLGLLDHEPEGDDLRRLALASVVLFGFKPSEFGLSVRGRNRDLIVKPLLNGKRLSTLDDLGPETWGERLHRAYRRAKYEGLNTGQLDVARSVSRIRQCGTGTIPWMETHENVPERDTSRYLAWLMILYYEFVPADFGITADNTPLLRLTDEEAVRRILRGDIG